jgi:hypothetical protein
MTPNAAGKAKKAVFLLNLLQDVNMLRGLVYLSARETDAAISLFVSRGFIKRDRQRIWQREVARVAEDTGAAIYLYGTAAEVRPLLEDGAGIIVAASESNLPAHWETSDVFRAAPPGYLRITIQHGLECVGFLQSREHVTSHGRNVGFAADVVCSWFDAGSLTSLTRSERAKLYVSGPAMLLQQRPTAGGIRAPEGPLVCENLHSVRLRASGNHQKPFMETFFAFCHALAARGDSVTLRPHPGGQYVLKTNVALPANVRLDMRPIYDVDLAQYRFGISAPSTIVLDMVLANIPVGVWRDEAGVMDTSNYDGLTEISSLGEWLAFERDVQLRPDMILERQHSFLRRLSMPSPEEVYHRFARLIVAGLEGFLTRRGDSRHELESGLSAPARRGGLSGDMLVELNS